MAPLQPFQKDYPRQHHIRIDLSRCVAFRSLILGLRTGFRLLTSAFLRVRCDVRLRFGSRRG
ncbi:hypothetical protein FIBSPDRAFT_861504 [Athelia psychrophila]|uniref:Uncharacterized protein n=1 Tax=Athelia psychrophila TaxID=1759441 RepID=A0A166J4Q6_9AGAM|nr:hypothetical protein FIBSPDRAFT_878814 [Fibularhizoctonia sp. CBS 109695]KZP20499.1 hypothetical protein FIBSPDRAFT_861504 [Fibularhizoctonia sp. CBS 109695]